MTGNDKCQYSHPKPRAKASIKQFMWPPLTVTDNLCNMMHSESRGDWEIPTLERRHGSSARNSRPRVRNYVNTADIVGEYQAQGPVEVVSHIIDYNLDSGNWSPVELKQPWIDS